MAWTSADITTLKAAIASGVLSVEFKDRKVTYQSTEQMRAVLGAMQQEVDAAAGKKPYTLANTRKGFDA